MRRILRILLPILVVALVIVIALSRCNPNTPVIQSSEVGSSSEKGGKTSSTEETPAEPSTAEPPVTIEFKPTATSLYISRDGSLRTAEITDFSNKEFDKARYEVETLKNYISGWVDSYNNAKGKESVRIETIDVTDDTATLIMYYDSVNSFMDFQGADYGITTLRIGTAEYAARNFALSGLKDTNEAAVTPIQALQDEEVTVVAISGSGLISFAGEVKYMSNSLTLVDSNTVRLSSKSEVFVIFK